MVTTIKENINRVNKILGTDISTLNYSELEKRRKDAPGGIFYLVLPLDLVKCSRFTIKNFRDAYYRFMQRGVSLTHPKNGEYITDGYILIKDREFAEDVRKKIGIDTSVEKIPDYQAITPRSLEGYIEVKSTGYGCYMLPLDHLFSLPVTPCEIFIASNGKLTLLDRRYVNLIRRITGKKEKFYRKPFTVKTDEAVSDEAVVAVVDGEIKGMIAPLFPRDRSKRSFLKEQIHKILSEERR